MQFYKVLKHNSVLLIVIHQLLWGGSLATAEEEIQFDKLPPKKSRVETRTSGGTRGECVKGRNSITLVVPKEAKSSLGEVPKTTLPRPTFTWYVAQKSALPVKFTLVEPGKTLYRQELNLSEEGFVTFTLPEESPPLETGKEYRWTVSILCDRQNPSRNPFAQAWIQRVSPNPILKKEENIICNTYEKSENWYDALACRLKDGSKDGILQLLTQVGLEALLYSK